MFDVKKIFERQANWQKSRAKLSWTEKLRLAEILQEAALAMGSSQRISGLRNDQEVEDKGQSLNCE